MSLTSRISSFAWRRAIVALLMMPAFGCGTTTKNGAATDPSITGAIATDLPDEATDRPVELYWVTDDRIFRGRCENDLDDRIYLRQECQINGQSMDYATFKTRLDGGLSDTIRALQDEARTIQASIATIEGQIQSTLAEIEQIRQENGSLSTELEALRQKMVRFEGIVREYREQLQLVEQELDHVVDRDISELRTYIMTQLGRYQEQLSGISANVAELMDQLSQAQTDLSRLQEELDRLTTRLSNLQTDLSGVETRLQVAYDDFAVYQTTLDRLQSGLIHPILSDNTWFQRERQFVKRFDRIFNDERGTN